MYMCKIHKIDMNVCKRMYGTMQGKKEVGKVKVR